MKRGLVIGYGNSLRTDDGLGWHAATLLSSDRRFADIDVLARHQLTPELAVEVAAARVVVLIDARIDGGAPGSIEIKPVAPSLQAASSVSHHLYPETLAALTQEMFGRVPPMFVVSVKADSVAEGDGLSSVAEAALPEVVEEVVRLVSEGVHA